MNYVGYYRVSTKEQGDSGLGLMAQKAAVAKFGDDNDGTLIEGFQDVEAGGKLDREGLDKALQKALDTDSVIVINRIDRLSRDGFKVTSMMEEMGISYIDCDSPYDTDLIKNIKLAVAKEEREKIKKRTKEALNQVKQNISEKGYHISKTGRKITSLGNNDNLGGQKAVTRSVKARRQKAVNNPNNIRATAVIRFMRDAGLNFSDIVKFLNNNEFRTSRGNKFSTAQARNLFNGYSESEHLKEEIL